MKILASNPSILQSDVYLSAEHIFQGLLHYLGGPQKELRGATVTRRKIEEQNISIVIL